MQKIQINDLERVIGGTAYIKADSCVACGNCIPVCPNEAIIMDSTGVAFVTDYCNGCQLCESECPCEAIVID